MHDVSDTFTRKHALKTGHITVVPSWLDKYNNCYLLLNASSTQSGEFSRIEVQDVATNRIAGNGAQAVVLLKDSVVVGCIRPPLQALSVLGTEVA